MIRIITRLAFIAFLGVLLFTTGCIPLKETMYMQGGKQPDARDTLISITDQYYLRPNDYLYISVSTADPKLSTFFNANANVGTSGQQTNVKFTYYMIDDQMNIDFPFTGKINLKDCNLKMAKERIKIALLPYLKEANLIVKMANTQYTILGEVRKPGVLDMKKDQVTIFDAIGEAGDLTTYAKRKEVVLLRKTKHGEQTHVLDLTNPSIINSEYYFIYPNDLIYIRPMKARQWGIGETIPYGLIASLLAVYLTVQSITNN